MRVLMIRESQLCTGSGVSLLVCRRRGKNVRLKWVGARRNISPVIVERQRALSSA